MKPSKLRAHYRAYTVVAQAIRCVRTFIPRAFTDLPRSVASLLLVCSLLAISPAAREFVQSAAQAWRGGQTLSIGYDDGASTDEQGRPIRPHFYYSLSFSAQQCAASIAEITAPNGSVSALRDVSRWPPSPDEDVGGCGDFGWAVQFQWLDLFVIFALFSPVLVTRFMDAVLSARDAYANHFHDVHERDPEQQASTTSLLCRMLTQSFGVLISWPDIRNWLTKLGF